MPSFDVVSKVNMPEVENALASMKREIGQRFDFKGSNCSIELKDGVMTILADDNLKLKQMHELLQQHLARRKVEVSALDYGEPQKATGSSVRQLVTIKQGIAQELAKKLVKSIKDSKLKVQAQIQGDELRVTGKNRDDLQAAIALLRRTDVEQPLQYVNFRE
jgi:uncharacterized protein YajQ (UPF0234 family)